MKLATRAALAVLALTSWAAQAATFEVPLEGTWRYNAYSQGPCTQGPYDEPSQCIDGSLQGTFLSVTTPSAADGAYSTGLELSVALGAVPLGVFGFSSDSAVYDPAHPPITVSIVSGRVAAIDGFYATESSALGFGGGRLSYFGASGEVGLEVEAALVPEPVSGVLLLAGLVALVARRRELRYP